jgi:hypothetical protein
MSQRCDPCLGSGHTQRLVAVFLQLPARMLTPPEQYVASIDRIVVASARLAVQTQPVRR